jgi:hypothetical protein
VSHRFFRGLSKGKLDAILGLCWLRKNEGKFIVGSSEGVITCCDLNTTGCEEVSDFDKEAASSPSVPGITALRGLFGGLGVSNKPAPPPARALQPLSGIVAQFPEFDKLTSIHVDCVDSAIVASGYSSSVKLFDLETTKVLREYTNVSAPFCSAEKNERPSCMSCILIYQITISTRFDFLCMVS